MEIDSSRLTYWGFSRSAFISVTNAKRGRKINGTKIPKSMRWNDRFTAWEVLGDSRAFALARADVRQQGGPPLEERQRVASQKFMWTNSFTFQSLGSFQRWLRLSVNLRIRLVQLGCRNPRWGLFTAVASSHWPAEAMLAFPHVAQCPITAEEADLELVHYHISNNLLKSACGAPNRQKERAVFFFFHVTCIPLS